MFHSLATRRRRFNALSNRRSNKPRQGFRSRRLGLESLEARQLLSGTPEFQVLNDATTNIAYRYSVTGAPQGSSALVAANGAPRGVASTVAVEKTWVIDANRNVYVYNANGALLGSWSAGSMANNATPEGIATDGTDVWIVDSRSDKVFRYAGAASRLTGSQNAASSFNLSSSNSNPKDMVTDGVSLWVVDDAAKTDKVFKYGVTGSLIGSWTIDAANKTPTGITLDPASVGDLWIADNGTDRVYKYASATSRSSGSQSAASNFALTTGNSNSQGLVIPGRTLAEAPYEVSWVRQLGSAGDEVGRGVSADGLGNVYVSGMTSGSLSVANPTGTTTPFLAKYDSDGNSPWVQQPIPIPGVNSAGGKVAADSLGNVFQVVTGGLNIYNAAGELVWNIPVPNGEVIHGVTADDLGYAYTSSYEGNSAHIRKYDGQTGNVVWERTLATGGFTYSSGVSVDGLGHVYLTGYTYGALIGPNAGGADAFLAKYTDAGERLWARQFGSAGDDSNFQVQADALGNVYTSGQTTGSLGADNAGDQDIFLSKHDAAGNRQWIRQWGTSAEETDGKIWADGLGNVYVTGATDAALGGPALGSMDIVLAKYDAGGNQLWTTQIGTSGSEIASGAGITGDDLGNLYITGRTTITWGGPYAGGSFDAVLIKLSPPAQASAAAASSLATVDLAFAAMAWEASQQPAGDSTSIFSGGRSRKAFV